MKENYVFNIGKSATFAAYKFHFSNSFANLFDTINNVKKNASKCSHPGEKENSKLNAGRNFRIVVSIFKKHVFFCHQME